IRAPFQESRGVFLSPRSASCLGRYCSLLCTFMDRYRPKNNVGRAEPGRQTISSPPLGSNGETGLGPRQVELPVENGDQVVFRSQAVDDPGRNGSRAEEYLIQDSWLRSNLTLTLFAPGCPMRSKRLGSSTSVRVSKDGVETIVMATCRLSL